MADGFFLGRHRGRHTVIGCVVVWGDVWGCIVVYKGSWCMIGGVEGVICVMGGVGVERERERANNIDREIINSGKKEKNINNT